MLKLVEECCGTGNLERGGEVVRRTRYRISRYQEFAGNGMPVPGLHRIEGSVDATGQELVGVPLTLRLEDGRSLAITVASAEGRVLAEGHGPSRCCCC